MRLSRSYVPVSLYSGAELRLPPKPAAHISRVLRLRVGASLTLFNGRGGEYAAQIIELGGGEVTVRVGAHRAIERESPLKVTLLQGVARGERMDLIVQKATELGVDTIVPVLTEHGVVRLDADSSSRRHEHWQGIAIGACEQCGRNSVPAIAPILDLERACAEIRRTGKLLLLAPDGEIALGAALSGESALTLLIGPEGGLSAAEIRLARAQGFAACRLGPRILRTETAALAALAVMQASGGDLNR